MLSKIFYIWFAQEKCEIFGKYKIQTVPENMRKEECENTQQIFREENGTYAKTRNFKKRKF